MPRLTKKQIADQKAADAAADAAAAAAAAAAPIAVAPRVIDVDNFVKVRNSVFDRLQVIQDLIHSFSQDYIRQTNLLLGEPTTNLGDVGAVRPAQSLEQHLGALGPQFAVAAGPVVEEKKERKKRTHDPNAPKRPLTPYFLYMQTARPIIANDLGENAPKGAVQEEGQRRWASMEVQEKQGWNQAYQYNLRLYNARVHSYKNGNPDAKNMDDDKANEYANAHNITMPPVSGLEGVPADDEGAIAEQLQGNQEGLSEEAEKPSRTPKAKQPRKRKTATPAVDETPASPEKKRKRTSTKPADAEVEPKKSGRRKSSKN